MAEFSSRSAAIEVRKDQLIAQYASAHGHQPSDVAVLKLRQQATLETRPGQRTPELGRAERAVAGPGGALRRHRAELVGGRAGGPK
jgi:hypothetical protein